MQVHLLIDLHHTQVSFSKRSEEERAEHKALNPCSQFHRNTPWFDFCQITVKEILLPELTLEDT